MNGKTLSHFEVIATMHDNYLVRGFCSKDNPPQIDYKDTLCVFNDLSEGSAYTEVRTKDIARLKVKPVLVVEQEDPAQQPDNK